MTQNVVQAQDECIKHMMSNGLNPQSLKTDGEIHRFSIDGKKNKRPGWYRATLFISYKNTEYLKCTYGAWNEQSKYEFKSWDDSKIFDEKERKELHESVKRHKEETERKIKEEREKAAKQAETIWENASEIPPDETYLAYARAKGIPPVGVKFGLNPYNYPSIIIPLRNNERKIRTLQFISMGSKGKHYKTFLEGGEKAGNYAELGEIIDGDPFYIAEGYATAVSIYEATKQATIVAFDAGNLDSVTNALKAKYPKSEITIAADDDSETKGNPGKTKAIEVANKYKCSMVLPQFPEDFPIINGKKATDFNDLHVFSGIDAIKLQLRNTQLESPMCNKVLKQKLNVTSKGEIKISVNESEENRKENQNSNNKFKFLSAHSLVEVPPKPNWIIKSYLDDKSLGMIFGEPGCMKSFVVLGMGLCVASGTDWQGNPIRSKGVVFYIAGEGFSGLSKRLLAWSIDNKVNLKDVPFFVSNRSAQLLEKSGVQEVISEIEELKEKYGSPVLIIIDTLNRNFGSGDENSTEDMTTFVHVIDSHIKSRYGCAVLIVHHSPLNDKDRARGNSALRASLDWEYKLLEKSGGVRELSPTKVKNYEYPEKICFTPKSVQLDGWLEEDGKVMTSCVLIKNETTNGNQSPSKKLTDPQKVALNVLLNLEKINENLDGIHIDEWRQAAYDAGISKTDTAESKKKAFQRAIKELIDNEIVEFYEDLYRSCGTRDISGTLTGHVPI